MLTFYLEVMCGVPTKVVSLLAFRNVKLTMQSILIPLNNDTDIWGTILIGALCSNDVKHGMRRGLFRVSISYATYNLDLSTRS
jgi:hypothetical protein